MSEVGLQVSQRLIILPQFRAGQATVPVLRPSIGQQAHQTLLHLEQSCPVLGREVDLLEVAQQPGQKIAWAGLLQKQAQRHLEVADQPPLAAVR